MATKFLHGDLIQAKYGIGYETHKGDPRMIKMGTHGVLVKSLGGGRWWAYFHGYPLIVLENTADIKLR